jgi:hypothetical protein
MENRSKTPRDEIWDALADSFGSPRTKTEQAMFGKVVAELLEAGATPLETAKACEYVLARFDTPSPFAVVKWLSASLNQKPNLSKTAASISQLRSL